MRNRKYKGKYEEGLNHQYYVVQREFDRESDYRMSPGEMCCEQMILNNKIDGILPMRAELRNTEKQYKFCTDGLRSLEAVLCSGRLKGDFIGRLISRIISVIVGGAEFFLEENDYVIEPETIFISSDDMLIYVVYLPGYSVDLRNQLLILLESLMEKLDYNDRRATYITYSIYGKCKRDGITLEELKNEAIKWCENANDEEGIYFEYTDPEPDREIKSTDQKTGGNKDSEEYADKTKEEPSAEKGCISESISTHALKGGKTVRSAFARMLSGMKKTVKNVAGLLKESSVKIPEKDSQSLPTLTGEGGTVLLDNLPFFVGRIKKQCDLCIDSNDVSKFHARIGKRNGAYYVVDLGSEKGTTLNGVLLEPGLEEPIMSGDELVFGNKGYVFDDGEF